MLRNVYIRDGPGTVTILALTLGADMIFAKRYASQDHTRAFVVGEADDRRGWEVREEEDNHVVKRTWLRDWHGVEKAMMRFAIEATELQDTGWTEVQTPVSSVV